MHIVNCTHSQNEIRETINKRQHLFFRFNLCPTLSIDSIADLLVDDMTGADIYSICSNAWLSAVRRTIISHHDGKIQNIRTLVFKFFNFKRFSFQKAQG